MEKVAINGFGRIGRMFLRAAVLKDLDIVCINYRSADPKTMAYNFKHDSAQRRFCGDVCYDDKHLIVNNKKIQIFKELDVNKIPWDKAKAQYVVECTGRYRTMEKTKPFLRNGIKKVIVAAPLKDGPMFVMGVNSDKYCHDTDHIVSNASCTTNCLAPVAKVVNDVYGIEEGLMTTVHAVTMSQRIAGILFLMFSLSSLIVPGLFWYTLDFRILDGFSAKSLRDSRAAFQNIIPASTGAAKAVGKVIPALDGKLTGMSFRVPVANVSVVDLTCRLKSCAKLEDLKFAIKDASERAMHGILAYTEEMIVSSDLMGSTYSAVFDANASMALHPGFVKLIVWYDNEFGYSCRLVDLVKMIHEAECQKERCRK